MAWNLVEVPESEGTSENFTDEEVVNLYILLQTRAKAPFDDRNPEFTSYLKLRIPFKVARERIENKTHYGTLGQSIVGSEVLDLAKGEKLPGIATPEG